MKIDIQKRYSFKSYNSLIAYIIENGYELEYGDLFHIFNNAYAKKSKKYNDVGIAVVYLLDELKGEEQEKLVALLNKHFEFKQLSNNSYCFRCINNLIAEYLIKLEQKTRKNANFESEISVF